MLCCLVASSLTLYGAVAAPTAANAQSAPSQATLEPSPLEKGGQYLYDHGIYFNINWWEQFASNIGGERQGSLGNDYLLWWTYMDMDKLAGIPGATVRMALTERSGGSLGAKRTDTDLLESQFWGSGQTYQLSALSWRQHFFAQRVALEMGRMSLSNNFDRSNLYCMFQSNATCGNPYALAKIINKSPFPTAVWGGTLLMSSEPWLSPNPNIYAKAGAFDVNPTQVQAATHGLDWSTAHSTGYTLPWEVGYKWRTPGAMDDNRYDFGMVLDQANYSAKVFSKTFYNPSTVVGREAVFVQAQQLVWQTEPNTKRGFWGAADLQYGASGHEQSINFNPNVNVIWQGPFESRPNDYFAVQVGGVHFTKAFRNALYSARVALKGTEQPWPWQYSSEIDYSVRLTDWMDIMPNVQWIIHPDGLGYTTYTKQNVPNAVVFGVQLRIGISDLLGIPKAVNPWGGAVAD